MNGLRGPSAMGSSMNDGLWSIGDIAGREDAGRTGRQRFLVDQQSSPGRYLNACAFR